MKKDILSFLTGLAAGVVLGLMVRDKDKKMVQDTLADQINHLRKKCEELSTAGKDLVRDGIGKAKDIKKEYLS